MPRKKEEWDLTQIIDTFKGYHWLGACKLQNSQIQTSRIVRHAKSSLMLLVFPCVKGEGSESILDWLILHWLDLQWLMYDLKCATQRPVRCLVKPCGFSVHTEGAPVWRRHDDRYLNPKLLGRGRAVSRQAF